VSSWMAIVIFLCSLALSIISSLVLAQDLDRLGTRFHLAEGLLGLITALGADAPEISSAITAITSGQHDVGLGVVLGSNLFNLAALLGLSAVVAGQVRIGIEGLLLNGTVALLATLIIAALIFGWLQLLTAGILLGALFIPYVILSSLHQVQVMRLSLPDIIKKFICIAVSDVSKDVRKDRQAPKASSSDMLAIIPALVSIVLASVGMVNTATALASRWHISHLILGTFVLAMLTGIPNVLAAIHLALRRRGSAVVSESLNSNTLNLISGIFLPVLLLGMGNISASTSFSLWWLLGMTLCVIALAAFQGGLRRWNGMVIIALYLLFACIAITVW
jgi:cation:H+ antiporter